MRTENVNRILLSVTTATLLVLSGCGGSSSSDNSTPVQTTQPAEETPGTPSSPAQPSDTPTQTTTENSTVTTGGGSSGGGTIAKSSSGKAIDGILVGSTVCIDVNKNDLCDIPSEPNAITDNDGKFDIPSTTATGPLLLIGGIDSGTGLAFAGTLSAPEGSTVVTPLTSAIQSLVESGQSAADAQASIKAAFGLPDVDLANFDPFDKINDANASVAAQAVLAKQTELQVMVHTVAVSIAESGSSDVNSTMGSVFDTIAQNFKGATAAMTLNADTVAQATKDVADDIYASNPAARVAARTVAKEAAQTAVEEAKTAKESVENGTPSQAVDKLNAAITNVNTSIKDQMKTTANSAALNAGALTPAQLQAIEDAQKANEEAQSKIAAAKKAAEEAAAKQQAAENAAAVAKANGDAQAKELYQAALEAKAKAQQEAAAQAQAQELAAAKAKAQAEAEAKIAAATAAKAKAEAEAAQAAAAAAKAEAEARAAAAQAQAQAAKDADDLAAAEAAAQIAAQHAQADINASIVKSLAQESFSIFTQAIYDVNETVSIKTYIETTEDSKLRIASSYTSKAVEQVEKAQHYLAIAEGNTTLITNLADTNSTDVNTTTKYKNIVLENANLITDSLTTIKGIKADLDFKIANKIAMEAKADRINLIAADINHSIVQVSILSEHIDGNTSVADADIDSIRKLLDDGYDVVDITKDANSTYLNLKSIFDDFGIQEDKTDDIDAKIRMASKENNETRAQEAQDSMNNVLDAAKILEAEFLSKLDQLHNLLINANSVKTLADTVVGDTINTLVTELRTIIMPDAQAIAQTTDRTVLDSNATLGDIKNLADRYPESKELNKAKNDAQASFDAIVTQKNALLAQHAVILQADVDITNAQNALDEEAANITINSARAAIAQMRTISNNITPLLAQFTTNIETAQKISLALENPLLAPSFAITMQTNSSLSGVVKAQGLNLRFEVQSITNSDIFDNALTTVDNVSGAFNIAVVAPGDGQVIFRVTDDLNNTIDAIYDIKVIEKEVSSLAKYDLSNGGDIDNATFDAAPSLPIPADVLLSSFYGDSKDGILEHDTIEFSTLDGDKVIRSGHKDDVLWHDGRLNEGNISLSLDGVAFDPSKVMKVIKISEVIDDATALSNDKGISFPSGSKAYKILYLDATNEFDNRWREVRVDANRTFASLEEFFYSGFPVREGKNIKERALMIAPDSNISDDRGELIEVDRTGEKDGSDRGFYVVDAHAGHWEIITDPSVNSGNSEILAITPKLRTSFDPNAFALNSFGAIDGDTTNTVVSTYFTVAGGAATEYLYNEIASGAIMDDYNDNVGSVLVDPYIVGATLCEDKNLNDTCDPDEQLSTETTQKGNFVFKDELTPGSHIIIFEQGDHEGKQYDLEISAVVDANGRVAVISPMTTFLEDETTSQDVADLLNNAASNVGLTWSITPELVESNPVAGGLSSKTVAQLSDDDFIALQGSLTSYGVLKVMNSIEDKYPLSEDEYNAILQQVIGMTLPAVVGALNKTNLQAIISPLDSFRDELINNGIPQEIAEKGLPEPTTDIVIKMGVAAIDRLADVGVSTDGNQTAMDGNYTAILNNIEDLGAVYYGYEYRKNLDYLMNNSGGAVTLDTIGEELEAGYTANEYGATGFRFDDNNTVEAIGIK